MDQERLYVFEKKKLFHLVTFGGYVAIGLLAVSSGVSQNTLGNFVLDASLYVMQVIMFYNNSSE